MSQTFIMISLLATTTAAAPALRPGACTSLHTALQSALLMGEGLEESIPLRIPGCAHFPALLTSVTSSYAVSDTSKFDLHRSLFLLYDSPNQEHHAGLLWVRGQLERAWFASDKKRIWNNIQHDATAKDLVHSETKGFDELNKGFDKLLKNHRVTHHPLQDLMANKADEAAMKKILRAESAMSARFLTFVSMSFVQAQKVRPGQAERTQTQLAILENMEDELGNGKDLSRHSTMFSQMLTEANVTVSGDPLQELAAFDWRAIAGMNTFYYLGTHQKNFYLMMGALYAGEASSCVSYPSFVKGLGRLNSTASNSEFYNQHSELDLTHSEEWLREGVMPLLKESKAVPEDIVVGFIMALDTMAGYYDALFDSL